MRLGTSSAFQPLQVPPWNRGDWRPVARSFDLPSREISYIGFGRRQKVTSAASIRRRTLSRDVLAERKCLLLGNQKRRCAAGRDRRRIVDCGLSGTAVPLSKRHCRSKDKTIRRSGPRGIDDPNVGAFVWLASETFVRILLFEQSHM
jgi:hypothetical protein